MTRTRPLSADQRAIRDAMLGGAVLYRNERGWWLRSLLVRRVRVNGNSCRGLLARGAIREEPIGTGAYVLTEAGRKAR